QRLVLYAVSKIQREDDDFMHYDLDLAELAELTDMSRTRVYADAVRMAKGLMSKPVAFVVGPDETLIANWLDSVRVNGKTGRLTFTISPTMKPYLLALKGYFTSYRLEYITGFESKYAFRIYELAKQFESTGLRVFTVDGFKEMLDIQNMYRSFNALKNRVIIPALNDINTHSDLIVEPKYRKRRQAITHIEFHITSKDAKPTTSRPKPKTKTDTGPDPAVLAAAAEAERVRQEAVNNSPLLAAWEAMTDEEKAEWPSYLAFRKANGRKS
ncbi:MAG: RepB family plasmid replication initiator protein, partial [Deltaproteobacteria bacterium]|nr:RepB family plasmid replication initiator protein [Deltaproteobacteria bacterium]